MQVYNTFCLGDIESSRELRVNCLWAVGLQKEGTVCREKREGRKKNKKKKQEKEKKREGEGRKERHNEEGNMEGGLTGTDRNTLHTRFPSTDLGVGKRVERHDNVANCVLVLTLLSQRRLKTNGGNKIQNDRTQFNASHTITVET